MKPITTEQELRDFIIEARDSATGYRGKLAAQVGTFQCYYEGLQYINEVGLDRFVNTSLGRMWTRLNPDLPSLRVTSNHVTEKVITASAATYPSAFAPTIKPSVRDFGPSASAKAQTLEDLVSLAVKGCNVLNVARDVNLRRSVCGSYAFGLGIKAGVRPVTINGQTQVLPTKDVFAYEIHPTKLILDPAIDNRDLRQHDYVIHCDVWTINKIRSVFPQLQIKDEDLQTVGQLTPYEQGLYDLSAGRLWGRYKQYSGTKGARVYQVHRKDATGRFGEYYVAIELSQSRLNQQVVWANKDNPTTPFGGDGLPIFMIHGHRRTSGMFGIGEVGMAKDSQDIINLMMTMVLRHTQQFTSPRFIIDKRFFGTMAQDEDIRGKISNGVGMPIIGSPTSADRNIQPPHLLQSPPFQPGLVDLATMASQKMRADTFRTDANTGLGAKSHVPNQVVQTLLQEGDRVMGIRREEDCDEYERMLTVLLGTTIKHVQERSASTLAKLEEEGFDVQDISTILETDANYPTCDLNIDEADLTFVSDSERRQTLALSLQTNAITPLQYQMGMAELDQPLTDADRYMRVEIEKMVARLLMGEQWQPKPLGAYNEWVLASLRKALFDKRVKFNPQLTGLVEQAIMAQIQMNVQEQLAASPEYQMQQAARTSAPPQEEPDQSPQTLADLVGAAG